jgi:hypothetical protein
VRKATAALKIAILDPLTHLPERMRMYDNTPTDPMNAENVEEFEVFIFESRDLVVSVIPLLEPGKVAMENYELSQA